MAEFTATFQTDGMMTATFCEDTQTLIATFSSVTEYIPSNYGLITRIGNIIRVS